MNAPHVAVTMALARIGRVYAARIIHTDTEVVIASDGNMYARARAFNSRSFTTWACLGPESYVPASMRDTGRNMRAEDLQAESRAARRLRCQK